MLIASMPPEPLATPAPITMRLQTDKRTYVRGDQVGLKVVVTNVAPVRTSISEIAQNAPEWQSEVFLTRPDGSTTTCTRPDNGELLSISGMYPSIEPGKELTEPSTGFRSLTKWGCDTKTLGTYRIRLRIEILERSPETRS